VGVRNSAKHWQTMVLAGTCQLKDKSLLALLDSVDPLNPYPLVSKKMSPGSAVDGFQFPV